MPRKQITLSDIAKACGTSNVTVSKALSGKRGVSDELRAEIFAQAEKLGYVSPKHEQGSAADITIGILIPERFINPNGSFYWALYNSIVQTAKKRGISCMQENLSEEEERSLILPKLISDNRVNGLISLGQVSAEYLRLLREKTEKIVLLDYYLPEFDADSIVSNGFFGGYKLTRYLINEGHKKIGFVGTRLATSSIFDRYMGYMKAMLESGLAVDERWIIEDRTVSGELFTEISFPKQLPTALVCNCDETAFKVIRCLNAAGVSVPEDVSVVGYDNYLISEICNPPITTINVDSGELAELAVSTLLARIAEPKTPTRMQMIDGRLVLKGSVKKV